MGRFLLHYFAISLPIFAGSFSFASEAFAATKQGNVKAGSTRRKSKLAPRPAETSKASQNAPLASSAEVSPTVTAPAQKSSQAPASNVRPRAFIMQPGNAPVGHVDLSALVGAWAFFGYFHYDVGARVGVRLYDPGFLPMLNNSVAIDAGLFYYGSSLELGGYEYRAHYLRVPLYLRWDFHVAEKWTAFPMVGPEMSMLLGSSLNANAEEHDYFRSRKGRMEFGAGYGIGAFWHFAENASMRFELDEGHGMLRVGASLRL
jgi:hypothetical protein